MPNIDEAAKAWELELSGRVGRAIQARRNALKLTAVQLSERTKTLGYPITRVAITKIEGNTRAGKLDVAEVLVLAQALEIPPALLLFPGFPDGPVQGLPGNERSSAEAVWWVSGTKARHEAPGVDLVDLVEQRAQLMWELNKLDRLLVEQLVVGSDAEAAALNRRIEMNERQLAVLDADIQRARTDLWGGVEVGGSDD